MAIRWSTNTDTFDLAYMHFKLTSTSTENGSKLSISEEQIEELKKRIDAKSIKAQKLEKALSYIPNDALFHPSMSPLTLLWQVISFNCFIEFLHGFYNMIITFFSSSRFNQKDDNAQG